MIPFHLPSKNSPYTTDPTTTSWASQERECGPLSLWNFHAILLDPESTQKQVRHAKHRMLEVLENPDASEYRPFLVPALRVPEPGAQAFIDEAQRLLPSAHLTRRFEKGNTQSARISLAAQPMESIRTLHD